MSLKFRRVLGSRYVFQSHQYMYGIYLLGWIETSEDFCFDRKEKGSKN